jgi:hypothetical protein
MKPTCSQRFCGVLKPVCTLERRRCVSPCLRGRPGLVKRLPDRCCFSDVFLG